MFILNEMMELKGTPFSSNSLGCFKEHAIMFILNEMMELIGTSFR
jgi:hypothetical protein